MKRPLGRAIPKTRLVSGMALGKAAKGPLFPLNLGLLSQNLKFWESFGIFGVLFFAAGAAVMAQEPGLEELLPGLRDRAVILNIGARVVENNQNEVWNSSNSRVTISGRPVGLKLVGTNVVVAVQFTPYMRPGGKNILVAQGQIWIDIPNEGIRYQTTMQTIPLELGEQIYFFPLGSVNSPNGAHIEIKLKLEPYTANEQSGQSAGAPPPDPKAGGPLPAQGNESP